MSTLRFKGKAPEIIKIAIAAGVVDTFFDSGNDYEPEWFDSTALDYVYGDQVFTDVVNQRNMVFLSESISGTCLEAMNDFIKLDIKTDDFISTDVPGQNISDDFISDGTETIKLS